MKSRKLLLDAAVGGIVCFVTFTLIYLLMQKWNLFDFQGRSLASIIIEGFVVSILFSVFMFFYSKNRLKKKKAK